MNKRRKKKTIPQKIGSICNLAAIFIVIALILICLPISVPKIFGYDIYNVISGSMEPELSVGSAVYAVSTEPAKLKEGDIIVFYGSSDSKSVTTHRVISNDMENQELQTKGDANAENDFYPVSYNLVVGKVVWKVPYLGGIAAILSTMQGKIYGAGLLALAVILKIASMQCSRSHK